MAKHLDLAGLELVLQHGLHVAKVRREPLRDEAVAARQAEAGLVRREPVDAEAVRVQGKVVLSPAHVLGADREVVVDHVARGEPVGGVKLEGVRPLGPVPGLPAQDVATTSDRALKMNCYSAETTCSIGSCCSMGHHTYLRAAPGIC